MKIFGLGGPKLFAGVALNCLAASAGGVAGGFARFFATRFFGDVFAAFPAHTLALNLIGCFGMGLLTPAVESKRLPRGAENFLAFGFCGGLTTLSAFVSEWHALVHRGYPVAVVYPVASVAFGIVCHRVGCRVAIRKNGGTKTPFWPTN